MTTALSYCLSHYALAVATLKEGVVSTDRSVLYGFSMEQHCIIQFKATQIFLGINLTMMGNNLTLQGDIHNIYKES